ncbi:DUF475 domain-containing protein [Gordonia sp. PS3]|uniref:DUF475 domain-containing protein n=1 Tax=Gordonia sihwensis NBRC 108236 TaxID=1223544 RepID=L7LMI1_9ACTN|nr:MULTISPECIES: DUF475 domain-containing protein [Gordonia]AUH67546.1 DUF475 domain-containing protein [Gordonia sp. YC-JH1]KXT56936.1 membrane protein [Gordonia sp. QH-12]MBY4568437.1 hypothetical protein [Gordonia sihwensis]GAC61312.1 hypothetical protein GSI01S_16_00370 [Gordonia sihwensis NBRC 108236]
MTLRIFGMSFVVSIAALVAAFLYGGSTAVLLTLVLGVLEVSLSFDNAVINATVLQRMSDFWQRMFLTIGVIIAVFGMRLAFPLGIVWLTAGLDPVDALHLALNPPTDGSPTYESIVTAAHPQIASFGGMFLLMLFLGFLFEDKELTWLSWIERPLLRIGRLREAPVVVALTILVLAATLVAPDHDTSTVMVAGVLGVITYIVVNGLGRLFHIETESGDGPTALAKATGRAGFFLFLYLEVLDASFSFDGVIGAFAITADPIIIALGLGLIGAMFVRSLTIYLVHRGTLSEYVFLEHGAHWAIGALALLLLYSLGTEVPETVTGLIGLVLILASLATSIVYRRRNHTEGVHI